MVFRNVQTRCDVLNIINYNKSDKYEVTHNSGYSTEKKRCFLLIKLFRGDIFLARWSAKARIVLNKGNLFTGADTNWRGRNNTHIQHGLVDQEAFQNTFTRSQIVQYLGLNYIVTCFEFFSLYWIVVGYSLGDN